jgi:co-chaperonin GroES (HSP10)
MDEMKSEKIDLSEGYADIEPLNQFVLVEVITKDMVSKSAGGILIVKDQVEAAMPCLVVAKLSKSLSDEWKNSLHEGDVVEVADISRINYFWSPKMKQMALLKVDYIAGVYSKNKGE